MLRCSNVQGGLSIDLDMDEYFNNIRHEWCMFPEFDPSQIHLARLVEGESMNMRAPLKFPGPPIPPIPCPTAGSNLYATDRAAALLALYLPADLSPTCSPI
jgi:hypothetical protein